MFPLFIIRIIFHRGFIGLVPWYKTSKVWCRNSNSYDRQRSRNDKLTSEWKLNRSDGFIIMTRTFTSSVESYFSQPCCCGERMFPIKETKCIPTDDLVPSDAISGYNVHVERTILFSSVVRGVLNIQKYSIVDGQCKMAIRVYDVHRMALDSVCMLQLVITWSWGYKLPDEYFKIFHMANIMAIRWKEMGKPRLISIASSMISICVCVYNRCGTFQLEGLSSRFARYYVYVVISNKHIIPISLSVASLALRFSKYMFPSLEMAFYLFTINTLTAILSAISQKKYDQIGVIQDVSTNVIFLLLVVYVIFLKKNRLVSHQRLITKIYTSIWIFHCSRRDWPHFQ